jgi:hypothetical protein
MYNPFLHEIGIRVPPQSGDDFDTNALLRGHEVVFVSLTRALECRWPFETGRVRRQKAGEP